MSFTVSWLGLPVRWRTGKKSMAARSRLFLDAGKVELPTAADCLGDAFEQLPLAIVALDEQDVIVKTNAQAQRLFGYRRDELAGHPIGFLIADTHVRDKALSEALAASQQTGELAGISNPSARRKDGSLFRVEVASARIRLEGGGRLVFVIDRTDRDELRRNHEDLAHLTRVSTMGQLAASLAHELNQPLTAILSNVQAAQRFMAADPIDLPEVRDILNDIVQDNYRASEVIRRIRAVVKKGDLEVMPLDLASVVHEVVQLVRSDAIVRGIRVALDIESNLPSVLGDKVQLQQVMLNLLLNAFDAMSNVVSDERVVAVTARLVEHNMVRIGVRDQGHGLTADKLDKIFKPFFTSKPQGLGLGLSISQSIIDMHHGRLWAENNSNGGATFHILLPACDAHS
jgi:two-component system sensor kinase FixL